MRKRRLRGVFIALAFLVPTCAFGHVAIEYQGNALTGPNRYSPGGDFYPAIPGASALSIRIEFAWDSLPASSLIEFRNNNPDDLRISSQGRTQVFRPEYLLKAEMSDGIGTIIQGKDGGSIWFTIKTDRVGAIVYWVVSGQIGPYQSPVSVTRKMTSGGCEVANCVSDESFFRRDTPRSTPSSDSNYPYVVEQFLSRSMPPGNWIVSAPTAATLPVLPEKVCTDVLESDFSVESSVPGAPTSIEFKIVTVDGRERVRLTFASEISFKENGPSHREHLPGQQVTWRYSIQNLKAWTGWALYRKDPQSQVEVVYPRLRIYPPGAKPRDLKPPVLDSLDARNPYFREDRGLVYDSPSFSPAAHLQSGALLESFFLRKDFAIHVGCHWASDDLLSNTDPKHFMRTFAKIKWHITMAGSIVRARNGDISEVEVDPQAGFFYDGMEPSQDDPVINPPTAREATNFDY